MQKGSLIISEVVAILICIVGAASNSGSLWNFWIGLPVVGLICYAVGGRVHQAKIVMIIILSKGSEGRSVRQIPLDC